MDRRVGGQNAARLELNLSSVEVGDEAACLPHQCDTRRYIPWRQPMLPIRVQPSGRDPGKIEGCCSKSAQPRDFLLHGGVLIARKNDVPAAGMRKRAGNDRLRKLSACSHPQPAIIEKGAFAPLGREQVVAHRIIDDARNDSALPLERDRDRKMRDAVKKIQRAVERIDDPAVGLVGAFMQPAFLSQEAVAGTCVFELGPQCLFRAPIRGSDEACGPLPRDLQLLDLPEIPLERAACLVRGLDHDVEERGAEHGTGAGQTDYEGGARWESRPRSACNMPSRQVWEARASLMASSQGFAAFSAAVRISAVCFSTNRSSGISLTPPALATMCHLIASTGSALRPRPTAKTLARRFCARGLPLRAAFCSSAAANASFLATPLPLNNAMAYSTWASVLSAAEAAASRRAACVRSWDTPRPSL